MEESKENWEAKTETGMAIGTEPKACACGSEETSPELSCSGHCGCCHRKKERSEEEYKDLMNRLSRIEGQIRGIKGMVERDAYCPDILTQVAAANAALSSFAKRLLASHIRTCVADDIRAGKDETIDELLRVLQKLMR